MCYPKIGARSISITGACLGFRREGGIWIRSERIINALAFTSYEDLFVGRDSGLWTELDA